MKSSPGSYSLSEKIFISISGILAVLSVFFFVLTVFSPGTLSRVGLTGFVAGQNSTGIVNISIQSGLIINFTTDIVDWGSGRVDTGADNATLDTSRSTAATKMLNGNWTGGYNASRTSGFVIENIGNTNATLYIKTASNSTTFIGGHNPLYQINVTNNKTGSCWQNASTLGNASSSLYFGLGPYYDVNATTGDGTRICDSLAFDDSKDQVRVHILLRVPSDSKTGTLNDTVTATTYTALV